MAGKIIIGTIDRRQGRLSKPSGWERCPFSFVVGMTVQVVSHSAWSWSESLHPEGKTGVRVFH